MTNVDSVDDLANKLNGDVSFVILIGNPSDQVKFLWEMEHKNVIHFQWILYNVQYKHFKSDFQRISAFNHWRIASFDSHTIKYYIDSNNDYLIRSVITELGVDGQLTADQLLLMENCKDSFENQIL